VSGISAPDLLSGPPKKAIAKTIADRLSQELVIALVGPIGSGVSTTGSYIKDVLANEYGYKVFAIIKPSEIIKSESHRVDITIESGVHLDVYVQQMQSAGNKLREKFGSDYLAEKVVECICKYRREDGGYSDTGILLPGRRAYIIDSLKNTEELDLLKQIYGETFCMFGVFATDAQRRQRLIDAGASEDAITAITDRDQGEVATFGQKTRKLFVNADFFLCNDHKKDELKGKVSRYISLIFETAIHTPTRAEAAMYEASASAANSACMSRQVGAAIVSSAGELISVGWNDVPKYGGGLYREDDQSIFDKGKGAITDLDNRCFKWGGCICHNETRRSSIVDNIAKKIFDAGLTKKNKT
jgi:deoxycytidylate deaminase